MSLSSLGTETPATAVRADTVADLLAESLRLMRDELAACHVRVREALSDMIIRCRVDDELFTVGREHDGEGISVGPARLDFTMDVRTSRLTILDLVEGRAGLLDVVRLNRLELRGPVRSVERLSRAMTAYLHGAARSQSFPSLLSRLKRIEELGE